MDIIGENPGSLLFDLTGADVLVIDGTALRRVRMGKYRVFIDGGHGTTGLEIQQRLAGHSGVELIHISEEERKNLYKRVEIIREADLSFLCLPDPASREVIEALNGKGRVLDASTAHRTHPEWVYGLPEMTKGQRERIREASRVSVPGCHATGFVLLLRPLREKGLIPEACSLTAFSVTGYSGGGKGMIQQYERAELPVGHSGQYGLSQNHKHLPEMKKMALLSREPVFVPVVGNYYRGMVVSVPLRDMLNENQTTLEALEYSYRQTYEKESFIHVRRKEEGFLYGDEWAKRDDVMITIYGSEESPMVAASLDNLGKGASGAAVQCMNIMLGLPENTGLRINKEEEKMG